MKKIILKINQKGIMFSLSGKKFRSPVEIDISNMKIDPILSQMMSSGVTDYEISTVEKIDNLVDNKSRGKPNVIVIDSKDDKINELNERIENLECKLYKILNDKDTKEKEWEQNNKDIDKLKLPVYADEKPKVIKGEQLTNPKNQNKKLKNVKNKLPVKKVIIEELEDFDDIHCVELKNKVKDFKIKNFEYEEINEPFKLSSDIEKLKKYKK